VKSFALGQLWGTGATLAEPEGFPGGSFFPANCGARGRGAHVQEAEEEALSVHRGTGS
jgi:hypothetical protein